MTAAPHTHAHFESIRVLRGLAALAVAIAHLPAFVPGLPEALAVGKAGVDVFFVVSGFVMAVSTAGDPPGSRSAGRFLWRRLARIVPLYWAVSLLLALLFVSGRGFGADRPLTAELLWRSLLFVPVHGAEGDIRPLLGVGWTLDYEMYFYLCFAAVLAAAPRQRLLATAALLLALHGLGRWLLPGGVDWIANAGLVLEFGLGLLLAGVRHRPGALVGVIVAAALGAALSYPALAALHPLGPGWDRALSWGLVACAVVGAGLLTDRWRAQTETASFGARSLGALGDASYSLYLTHSLVFAILRRVLAAAGLALPAWAASAVLLAGAVAVALLVWRRFERPTTAWLQRRLGPAQAGLIPERPV